MNKKDIKSLSFEELRATLQSWGVEGYRFNQLFSWLYQKDVSSFSEMTNLAKTLREKLDEHFFIGRLKPTHIQISSDGTRKFLFQLNDRESIESVLIPNGDRQTLCVSSQVGCAMGCSFCLTATLGLTRNLRHEEIIEQVMAVQREVKDDTRLTNIVYMGMGEPLHNLTNVIESLKYMLDERGLKLSKNRITVSTSGLVPQMLKFGELMDVKLAISLSATSDPVRDRLIPINRKYPLAVLKQACHDYPLKRRHRITFEYTLLKGVNDSLQDAARLIQWLQGIPAKLNLIPFNAFPGAQYQRSSDETMLSFQKYLLDRGVQTNIRHSRGLDILGACGQLKAHMEKKTPA